MSNNEAFIHDDFLLENDYAVRLYHDYAKDLPIIDYHCHLPPDEIAGNRTFENISRVWINGDHYKWRAMRTMGIDEKFITGDASDLEKFKKWASVVPYTLRNPLFHWTHLELARYFDIFDYLDSDSAESIFNRTSEQLTSGEMSCQSMIKNMNVETVCTTDDPTDNLKYHKEIENNGFGVNVRPAFRPDKAILIGSEAFNDYVDALGHAADIEINSYRELCDALVKRLDFFHKAGCRLSDHGLEHISSYEYTPEEVRSIFEKRRHNLLLTDDEEQIFMSAILVFLAEQYHERGWVQQFHLGALRNNNHRMERKLGPDTGWDSIGDFKQARSISHFLNTLDARNKLTKTIIYNLNPADNEVMASMIGNFNDGSVKGKIQFGSAWWFLDQKDGMTKQLNALSNMGLISCFIGMLTDSRSFLSYPRHEYFRRLVCNIFGTEMASGELPTDHDWVGKIIRDICYHNAKNYFDF